MNSILKLDSESKMKYFDSLYSALVKFMSMLILVLAPIRPTMIAVSVLIILDMVTGILAARKRGEKITSSGLKKTISKTFLYQASIMVAFLMEYYLLEGVPVVKVVAGIIALTEGKSFFENIHRLTGIDFWNEALTKIQAATVKRTPEEIKTEELPKPKKRKSKKKLRK